jgi:general secretion pathway protein D
MTSRSARLCLAVATSFLCLDALAQNPQQPSPLPTNPPATPTANNTPAAQPGLAQRNRVAGDPNELVQLKLPDADINTMLDALEIYTGKIILRPQQLTTQTYNLRFPEPIPKWEAVLAIETVLALNGIGTAPMSDRFLKVINLQNVKTETPEMITGSTLDLPQSGRSAAKFFQLEFARATEVQPLLQNILNPFYGGAMVLPNANALLITDSISNLQRVERLLQDIDRPSTAGMKPKFYTLNEAKASDVVNKLRTIITGTLQMQVGTATNFSADDRTNQIILLTDPRQHEFFDDLIRRLDQRADPNTRNDVIYLKHAKAEEVVTVITRIINGQTTAQRQGAGSVRPGLVAGPQPGAPAAPANAAAPAPAIVSGTNSGEGANEFSALMTVVNDNRSNSIVVSGTADDIRLVRALVDKLDIVLSQVRLEVVIAEVTLDDNNESGISALGLKIEGDKLVGFSGTETTVAITNGVVTRPGAVSGAMDLAAEIAIKTTPRKRNNSIITVPSVTTSHGKEAVFFSGETRPVVTGTIQSAAGGTTGLASSSTVTQQQIGTRITVTPFIGSDQSVQLDMKQTIEDVIGTVQVDQNQQYIIGRRETTNYVTAKSGDIIVLGGFRKDTNIRETNRLGPIPILGDIFGSRKKTKNRLELVIFLRPTVLTNQPTVDNADAFKRIERLPTGGDIKGALDPNYISPPSSLLEKITR